MLRFLSTAAIPLSGKKHEATTIAKRWNTNNKASTATSTSLLAHIHARTEFVISFPTRRLRAGHPKTCREKKGGASYQDLGITCLRHDTLCAPQGNGCTATKSSCLLRSPARTTTLLPCRKVLHSTSKHLSKHLLTRLSHPSEGSQRAPGVPARRQVPPSRVERSVAGGCRDELCTYRPWTIGFFVAPAASGQYPKARRQETLTTASRERTQELIYVPDNQEESLRQQAAQKPPRRGKNDPNPTKRCLVLHPSTSLAL